MEIDSTNINYESTALRLTETTWQHLQKIRELFALRLKNMQKHQENEFLEKDVFRVDKNDFAKELSMQESLYLISLA